MFCNKVYFSILLFCYLFLLPFSFSFTCVVINHVHVKKKKKYHPTICKVWPHWQLKPCLKSFSWCNPLRTPLTGDKRTTRTLSDWPSEPFLQWKKKLDRKYIKSYLGEPRPTCVSSHEILNLRPTDAVFSLSCFYKTQVLEQCKMSRHTASPLP